MCHLNVIPQFIVIFLKVDVLISWGCYNKVLQTRWLKKTTEIYSLTGLESRSLKSRCRQGCSFLAHRGSVPYIPSSFWLLLAILCVPCLVEPLLQSLPPSSHGIFPMCLRLFSLSYKGTYQSYWITAHCDDLTLT